jgi:hypothetical protein
MVLLLLLSVMWALGALLLLLSVMCSSCSGAVPCGGRHEWWGAGKADSALPDARTAMLGVHRPHAPQQGRPLINLCCCTTMCCCVCLLAFLLRAMDSRDELAEYVDEDSFTFLRQML